MLVSLSITLDRAMQREAAFGLLPPGNVLLNIQIYMPDRRRATLYFDLAMLECFKTSVSTLDCPQKGSNCSRCQR